MRIYLSSRWSRRFELQEIGDQLQQESHVITSRWIYLPKGTSKMMECDLATNDGRSRAAQLARSDMAAIASSQLFFALTEKPSNNADGMGGRHIEFGYAIGLHKPCLLCGYRENVFSHLEGVMAAPTLAAAYDCLHRFVNHQDLSPYLQTTSQSFSF